jgi:hypothetical protein
MATNKKVAANATKMLLFLSRCGCGGADHPTPPDTGPDDVSRTSLGQQNRVCTLWPDQTKAARPISSPSVPKNYHRESQRRYSSPPHTQRLGSDSGVGRVLKRRR